MKKINIILFTIFVVVSATITFSSCKKENDVIVVDPIPIDTNQNDSTPTKTLMEGVWVVTEAYDSVGTNILPKFQNHLLPVTVFYLSSDNTILSTAGPLVTYLVYGDSKFNQITSNIDQYFNYSALTFNGGEFFVADGKPDRFAFEMKLETVGSTNTLVEILSLFNIQAQWLKTVVYHKFMNIGVSFNNAGDKMTWVFDNQTTARYNMKDQYGDYVLWGGWPISQFSRCRFVLTKQSKSLNDVTTDAYANPPTKIDIANE